MGLLDNMSKFISKNLFGVQRPRDVVPILENIIHSNRDNDEKVRRAKPILMWLDRLSTSTDGMNKEANEVLNYIRNRYRDFLDMNGINI